MKIAVVGDPHGACKAKDIPLKSVDLILVTGDLGKANLARSMFFENIERTKKGLSEKEYSNAMRKRTYMEAYNSSVKLIKYFSKFAPVYTIFGNVENTNSETRKMSKEIGYELPLLYDNLNVLANVRVINNRVANFQGVRIGGLEYFVDTSWVREFKPNDYRERLKEAKKETDKAKRILKNFGNIDILLCHQPPYGVLDKVGAPAPKQWWGKHAGSKAILDYVKRKQPRYVFCGHIHEAKGKKKIGKTQVHNVGVAGDYVLIDV